MDLVDKYLGEVWVRKPKKDWQRHVGTLQQEKNVSDIINALKGEIQENPSLKSSYSKVIKKLKPIRGTISKDVLYDIGIIDADDIELIWSFA